MRLEGKKETIGTTPFDWVMPEDLADRLSEGQSVRLTFEKPGMRATTHTLKADQLKDGRAVVAKGLKPVVRRALGPAHSPSTKKPSGKKKAAKKAPAKKPKAKPKSGFTF